MNRPRSSLLHPAVKIIVAFIFLAALGADAAALGVPTFRGYVNDYAKMISADAAARIEADLRALEESDSTQIYILTVPSLEGEVLEEFAIRVFDDWKAGQKGLDNGVIFIVAQKERKIRIEVGRGLEGKLTDLAAGRIIDLVIKPKFKAGDFEGGFLAGVAALIEAVKGEFKGAGGEGAGIPTEKTPYQDTFLDKLCGIIFIPMSIMERSMDFLVQRPERIRWFFLLYAILLAGMSLFSLPAKALRYRIVLGAVGLPCIAFLTVWNPQSSHPSAGRPLLVLFCYIVLGGAIGALWRYFWEWAWRTGGGSGGGGSSGSSSYSSGSSSSGSSSSGSSSGGGGGSSGGGGASGDY